MLLAEINITTNHLLRGGGGGFVYTHIFKKVVLNKYTLLRLVYVQLLKSNDQSRGWTSFDFFNIFLAMKTCPTYANSGTILTKGMVT